MFIFKKIKDLRNHMPRMKFKGYLEKSPYSCIQEV